MKLNQVTVPSLNISKSIDFYVKLGLKLIVHSDNHYARFECPDGGSTFSIIHVPNLPTGDGIHVYFELQEDELNEKVQSLVEDGIQFLEMPTDKSWLWREAHVLDPDNNHIVLYYAGENRLNPPWRLQESKLEK